MDTVPTPPKGFKSWLHFYEFAEQEGIDLGRSVQVQYGNEKVKSYTQEEITLFTLEETRQRLISADEYDSIMLEIFQMPFPIPKRIEDYLKRILR